MTVPGFLPDWVPGWAQFALLAVIVLAAGAYLLMPFGVFGLRRRLDALDDRLDEMASDLRALGHRLPDPEMGRPAAWRREAELDEEPPPRRARAAPVPPPPAERSRLAAPEPAPPPSPPPGSASRGRRSEPQLNWPENRPRS